MNLEDVKSEWTKDSVLNKAKLSDESLGIPMLHSKYLNVLVDTKLKHTKTKVDLNAMKKLKTRYYKGELSREELEEHGWEQYQYNKPLKSELGDILDGDDDVAKLKIKIEYLETMIYALESILGSIRNRGFEIKNAISWEQYLTGN